MPNAALGYREIELVWWNVSGARRLYIPRPRQSNRIGSGKKGKPGSLSQGPLGFPLFLEEFHLCFADSLSRSWDNVKEN